MIENTLARVGPFPLPLLFLPLPGEGQQRHEIAFLPARPRHHLENPRRPAPLPSPPPFFFPFFRRGRASATTFADFNGLSARDCGKRSPQVFFSPLFFFFLFFFFLPVAESERRPPSPYRARSRGGRQAARQHPSSLFSLFFRQPDRRVTKEILGRVVGVKRTSGASSPPFSPSL